MQNTKASRPRRGSALIMVLGILAVLLLLAVTFSTFVRTERGGSTNLKNGVVAQTSLQTAIGRVMEAIDLSFDSPLGDDPVPAWPYPWLSSHGSFTNDYFQSDRLGDGDTAGAHVLTEEISRYLSPAQLALAKSARCDWAPILGSVNASRARTDGRWRGGLQGILGRPGGDDLLGRYAFIALDTTGLADFNMTGGGSEADRKGTSGSDTLSLRFLASNPAQTSDGAELTPFIKPSSLSTLAGARNFNSLAEARARFPAAFNETLPTTTAGDAALYPADLFAGFAPSLSDLDPEGNPKIVLPRRDDVKSYTKEDFKALLRRSFRAMVGMFARGRVATGLGANDLALDSIPIFSGSGSRKYNLSRSLLATVAMLDGLDEDFIPGQSASPACPYWSYLPDVSVDVEQSDGSTAKVTEKKCDFDGYEDPLNYPCTESAALLSSVFAYITIDDSKESKPNPDDTTTWKKTYNGTLHVGAIAVCQNRTMEDNKHPAKLDIEWEVMSGRPTSGTVSGGTANDIRNDLVELGEKTDFGDSENSSIVWNDFFGATGSASGSRSDLNDGDDQDSTKRVIQASSTHSFTIECGWNPNGSGESEFGAVDSGAWYPPVRYAYDAEQNGTENADVFVPIRVKARISSNGRNVQQVPAPAIDSKDWWVRVDAGLWHGPDSAFGNKDNFEDPKGHAFGWAFCVVPAFGFDTTGLATQKDGDSESPSATPSMHFWINNVLARSMQGEKDDFENLDPGRAGVLTEQLFTDADAFDNALQWTGGDDFGDVSGMTVWNLAQISWLFNFADSSSDEEDFSNVTDWMDQSGGAHRPDMLHALGTPKQIKNLYPGNEWKKHRTFVGTDATTFGGMKFVNQERLASELYSRIPAKGYETVADLGTVMCGPYETLSLFKTWRFNSDKSDFHPVLDYFTFDEDRYPTRKNTVDAGVTSDGDVNLSALDDSESLPAVHNGRVNLNAPRLVKCSKIRKAGSKSTAVRGIDDDRLNPYPIATVLNGAPYPAIDASAGKVVTNSLGEAAAIRMAAELCRSLEEADPDNEELWAHTSRFYTNENDRAWRPVVRNLSFLGRGGNEQNTFLKTFIDSAKSPGPMSDYEREGILRGIVDGFSTRGQTYLVIIRADAYSPKFGENESVEDGTTLATTHAIVELFRDPVPARMPDGSLPAVGTGKDATPVVYHNWYIRSLRVF